MLNLDMDAFLDSEGVVVVGVGDAGCQAVSRMIEEGICDVKFIGVNTDMGGLQNCKAIRKIRIGEKLLGKEGVAADPVMAERAAEENAAEISAAMRGASLAFIVSGMGGSTGTGAAPVVARLAKEMGILTVGMVTVPCSFEGEERAQRALDGLGQMEENVNTLILFEGDRLSQKNAGGEELSDPFGGLCRELCLTLKGILDMPYKPAVVNLDMDDLRMVMSPSGIAFVRIGSGRGAQKAVDAVQMAMEDFDALSASMKVTDIIIYVAGTDSLMDANCVANYIVDKSDDRINMLLGLQTEALEKDCCTVMLIIKGKKLHG